MTPGGRVLFGDGFWAAEPSAAALATIGALPRLEELHAAAAAAGFRIERDEVSDLAEWDAFEAGWRSGLEVSTDAGGGGVRGRAPPRVRGRLPRGDRLHLARARAAV